MAITRYNIAYPPIQSIGSSADITLSDLWHFRGFTVGMAVHRTSGEAMETA